MTTFFLTCALLGGAVLTLQLVLGIVGFGHDHDLPHETSHELHGEHADGLNLLSIRALSAGVAFFGLAGLAGLRLGLGWFAALAAVVGGVSAAVATAAVVRAMLRLESDGTLALEGAVGTTGTVYLSIPGSRAGAGKVHVTVQNRLVECRAVTSEEAIDTGAPVLVVDVEGSDTVVVVRNPLSAEVSHAVSR